MELAEDHAWLGLEAWRVEPSAMLSAASEALAATNSKKETKTSLGLIRRTILLTFSGSDSLSENLQIGELAMPEQRQPGGGFKALGREGKKKTLTRKWRRRRGDLMTHRVVLGLPFNEIDNFEFSALKKS